MKRISIQIILYMLCFFAAWSQPVPQGINYQAVARDVQGEIIPNQSMQVILNIVDAPNGGNLIYRETHAASTNGFGLLELVIGQGIPNAGSDFEEIDWAANLLYLQTTLNFSNQTVQLPAHPFQSVPYALQALKAGDQFWEAGNDQSIYYEGGNVGVGTADPQADLEVANRQNATMRIHAQGSFSEQAKLELVRDNAFAATDWRLNNDGGVLKIESATNNFTGPSTEQMRIHQSGGVGIGVSNIRRTLHVGGDDSRYVRVSADGNNFNTESGIELVRSQRNSRDWRMVNRGNALLLETTTDDFDNANPDPVVAFLDNSVLFYDRPLSVVGDPLAPQDAVNLRTLNNALEDVLRSPFPRAITPHNIRFNLAECATYCRNLVLNGQDDWGLPSAEQASHFLSNTDYITDYFIWTSSKADDGAIQLNMNSGFAGSTSLTISDRYCHCVR